MHIGALQTTNRNMRHHLWPIEFFVRMNNNNTLCNNKTTSMSFQIAAQFAQSCHNHLSKSMRSLSIPASSSNSCVSSSGSNRTINYDFCIVSEHRRAARFFVVVVIRRWSSVRIDGHAFNGRVHESKRNEKNWFQPIWIYIQLR